MIQEYSKEFYQDVVEIFWLTSAKKNFESDQEKINFQHKYLDDYLTHKEKVCLVYTQNQKAIGYIIGVLSYTELEINQHALLKHFKNELKDYPTELHINFHPNFQGGGKGSQLIQAFEDKAFTKNSKGIFLLTGAQARNVHFYLKNDYLIICEKEINGLNILFMGKCSK